MPAGGGDADAVAVNTVLEYDTTGDSYTETGTMTQARWYHAITGIPPHPTTNS